jgi:hypothetical protein
LFFINPPYGEGSSGKETDDAAWHKAGVADGVSKTITLLPYFSFQIR